MPLYAFTCQVCGKTMEIFTQKIGEEVHPPCESCGGETRKKMTASNFQLKGSGWAKDGYS